MRTGLIGTALSRPGNIVPGGDLPPPTTAPYGRFVPVERLDDYWISAWSCLRRRVAGTGHLVLAEYDAAGGLLALTEFATLSAVEPAWTRHALHMGPNDQLGRRAWQADTAQVKLAAYADGTPDLTWDVDALQVERGNALTAYAPRPQELIDFQVDRTQIADDAITTPKLIAGAVVAGKIAAGAITAEKIEAGAVVAGKIAAGAITTADLSASASISRVSNDGAKVVIGPSGIAVTGGAITVTNTPGTVIIDGTSNMFKIAASGTVSIAVAAGVSPNGNSAISDTILSGLGAFATIPICFAGVSFGNALDGNVRQVNREFQFLEGDVAQSRYKGVIEKEVSVGSFRQASTQYAGIRIGCSNYGGTTVTGYARYHLCREAAL